jgi:SNF2 family DNA or RNA helicase
VSSGRDYEICTYGEIVRKKQDYPDYTLIIFDEAHYLKNPDAKRTRACAALAEHAYYKLALTGTPVVNRPIEIQPVLTMLGSKMSRVAFAIRYCAAQLKYVPVRGGGRRKAWDFNGASNTDELNRELRKYIMVRRTKEEVLKELPSKVRQVIAVNFRSGESEDFRNRFSSLSLAADVLDEVKKIPFEELAKERYNVAIAKLPHVQDFLLDLLEEEEKVVVFAHHREVVRALAEGDDRVMLYGGMTEKQKDEAVKRFQYDPTVRVFVGQIAAAGVGLTLTAARTVVFAELDWVPGNVTQAEDRCHRIGQHDTVRVFHIVAEGSIDARLVRAIVDKQSVIEEITK